MQGFSTGTKVFVPEWAHWPTARLRRRAPLQSLPSHLDRLPVENNPASVPAMSIIDLEAHYYLEAQSRHRFRLIHVAD